MLMLSPSAPGGTAVNVTPSPGVVEPISFEAFTEGWPSVQVPSFTPTLARLAGMMPSAPSMTERETLGTVMESSGGGEGSVAEALGAERLQRVVEVGRRDHLADGPAVERLQRRQLPVGHAQLLGVHLDGGGARARGRGRRGGVGVGRVHGFSYWVSKACAVRSLVCGGFDRLHWLLMSTTGCRHFQRSTYSRPAWVMAAASQLPPLSRWLAVSASWSALISWSRSTSVL